MVALSGANSATYLQLWYALEAVGARISFINHNLTDAALTHCVTLCKPRLLLAERATAAKVEPCRADLAARGMETVVFYDDDLAAAVRTETGGATPDVPAALAGDVQPDELRSLIYTSGTTGLPKGVIMTSGRTLNTARTMAGYLKLGRGVKFYTCLPLYHGAAQGLCIGPVIFAGAAVALGRKFSHRTFWPEVAASGANHLQYVGELGRYLINAPPHPLETKHAVEVAWGNGMRPDVWERFRQRFHIPVIHELYAATDGLGASFNRNRGDFGRAAIGVRGYLWHRAMGDREVRARIDPDTEELMRDPRTGWCVRAGVDEPGEVLHRVEPEMREQMFRGYYENDGATEKRWLRDAFAPGDLWFRSGDLMRQDAEGRVYFVDRLGDTFRWHSENVSTNEVADVLGAHPAVAEASVYGVAVPHADGRCGCATLVLQDPHAELDRAGLAQHVLARLPRYAVPLFLRVAPALAYTGTFKVQKGQAKREGVDVEAIEKAGSKDRLFWLPPGAKAYEPYGQKEWEALKAGQVKL